MSCGQLFPAEGRSTVDPRTGAVVRQITSHPSLHHHPFYYLPCMDDAMQRLYFVSHRSGRPEICCELRADGRLLQLSEQAGINEWSVHPSHDGRHVYYTAGSQACRLDCATLRHEVLLDLGGPDLRAPGMVGAAMGTTSLSRDDAWWAVPVTVGAVSRLVILDTRSGAHRIVLERDTIGHPEFNPRDSTRLRYAGPYHGRLRVVNRDGSDDRLAYQRSGRQWIVHETWNPVRPSEILTVDWPRGCIGIDVDSGAVRPVCGFNAWHPSVSRDGRWMCADTVFPDRGLQLFDPQDGLGVPRTLCHPQASSQGAHWQTDHCPYDDEDFQQGRRTVYAPQHTHPHPSFSPDGWLVVFTSDRDGCSQVYEVAVLPSIVSLR